MVQDLDRMRQVNFFETTKTVHDYSIHCKYEYGDLSLSVDGRGVSRGAAVRNLRLRISEAESMIERWKSVADDLEGCEPW